jgi:uncharacterized protein
MSQYAKQNPEHAGRTRPSSVPMIPVLQLLREHLPALKEHYSIRSLGLFGSYVRGEQKISSDIDILVEFVEPPGLFAFIRLEHELSRILGRKVDLVMKDALKPAIGKRIMAEVVQV